MKRIALLFLALAAWTLTVCAQETAITDIRTRYAGIKQMIALMTGDNGMPPEFYHLTVMQNLPGTGGHKEDIYMYYDEEEGHDEEIYPPHYLTFLTSSYNFAAREFYEEYLYDADGKVAFIYARNPDIVFGLDYDFRLYFNQGKLFKAVIKCRPCAYSDVSKLSDVWDETAQTDSEGFREVYSGRKLPKEYEERNRAYLKKAEDLRKLFNSIDRTTYK